MATLRNLAIGVLKTLGADNIAKTTRAIRDELQRALPILGITNDPDTYGTRSSSVSAGLCGVCSHKGVRRIRARLLWTDDVRG
ncbi:hypothetical protein SRB17_88340 [Streptomyces sp. RB17]|uniref:hypothetical protein n=1 Tax=Streptomyces sp. RB17 TaxID=2585197 RepID=UPI00130A8415|nr:hypothetical protein [Streptomyces sp. RB17]MQY40801.1 hypothetical protein [Streptomyces sp. RB17]